MYSLIQYIISPVYKNPNGTNVECAGPLLQCIVSILIYKHSNLNKYGFSGTVVIRDQSQFEAIYLMMY